VSALEAGREHPSGDPPLQTRFGQGQSYLAGDAWNLGRGSAGGGGEGEVGTTASGDGGRDGDVIAVVGGRAPSRRQVNTGASEQLRTRLPKIDRFLRFPWRTGARRYPVPRADWEVQRRREHLHVTEKEGWRRRLSTSSHQGRTMGRWAGGPPRPLLAGNRGKGSERRHGAVSELRA
jgi:hypothetical protein